MRRLLGRPGLVQSGHGGFAVYRNILALVSALTLLQGAMAALAMVMSLKLLANGVAESAIGLVAAAYSAGFLGGTLIAPHEVRRIGHIRTFTLLAGVCALAALVLPLAGQVVLAWALLVALAGAGAAGMLTAGESWIANAAPPQSRGAILGFYHMVSKTGAIAAPFLVAAALSSLAAFMVVGGLFVASLLPVAATNRSQPELVAAKPFGPRRILELAPASVFAAFCAGTVNNSVAQLYPVFAAAIRPDAAATFAAQFNGALLVGAMIGLWPIGLLSDRFDRRIVIALAAAIGSAAAVGLALTAALNVPSLTLLLAAIFGAGSLSYYAVAVANAADRASPEEITSMMAGILVIWGIGSVIGPLIAGLFLQLIPGGGGLFLFSGFALAGLAVACLSRAAVSAPVPVEAREPFSVSPATSLAIAEFDPRGESDQPDLFTGLTDPGPQETVS